MQPFFLGYILCNALLFSTPSPPSPETVSPLPVSGIFAVLQQMSSVQKNGADVISTGWMRWMRGPVNRVRMLTLTTLLATGAVGATGCDDGEPGDAQTMPEQTASGDTGEIVAEGERSTGGERPDSTAIPYRTPEGGPARFAFRSGSVDMEYVGIMNGVRRLRFEDYGLREMTFDSTWAIDRNVPLLPTWSMLIMTPESYSIIDMRKGTGGFGPNETFEGYVREWREGNRPLGELVLDGSGGERLPDTLLLGKYPCRVYRQTGNGLTRTIYTHGGVPIGEAVTFGGNVNTGYRVLPRSVTFDVELPDSLFTTPTGYRLTPFDNRRSTPSAGEGG